MEIKTYLNDKRRLIDSFLKTYFDASIRPEALGNSMVYSLSAGGKRIRPILALASYEACGGRPEDIVPFAASLEFIHTYSLIHDDLPAMDDDDLRRGKPTNHKVFGEGMAVLAGDGLLTEAFYIIAECGMPACANTADRRNADSKIPPTVGWTEPQTPVPSPELVLTVIKELAMASGINGMVGGQAADLLSEDMEVDIEQLSFIHTRKTGALITVSVRMGALLAGADSSRLLAITQYAEAIGLAFQIIDDILDIKGESAELGKTPGSDIRKKKMTYPGLYGIEVSMEKAESLIANAIAALKTFDDRAEPLRELAMYILKRRN